MSLFLYLKEIRKQICEENNIALEFEECTFQGRCKGTCPKCEYELNFINNELKK